MSNKVKKSIALISALTLVTATTSALNVFAVDTTDDTDLVYTEFPFTEECENLTLSDGTEVWTISK